MIPNWLTGFPYSVMHSLNLDWLLKKVASIDPSGFVRSINDTLRPDPETGNLNLTAGDVGALGVYGTANNSLLLDGKPSAYYLTPVNLLDNSNFANPVNQRGYTNDTTVENTYFIDRWRSSSNASFTFNANGMTINASHCFQIVPSDNLKSGQVYTIACKMNGNILCYSNVLGETIGVWENGLVATLDTARGLLVYLTKTGVTYEWVALYEGAYTAETLPPYVPKPYNVELSACRYRYIELNLTSYEKFAFGESFGAGFCDFVIPVGNMAPGNATVTFPETGLYIDGASVLNATPIKTTVYGATMFLQLNDSQFTVGQHNIGTAESTAKITISRE